MKALFFYLLLFLSNVVAAQYSFERSYQFFSTYKQNSNGIIEDGLGGFYITSTCIENNYTNATVSHLNELGDTLWNTSKKVPNLINDPTYCSAIIRSYDGNILVHGNMGDTNSIYDGGHWLMKIDTAGNIIWFKTNFNTAIDFHSGGDVDYLYEFNNSKILVYITNGFFALFDSSGTFISAKNPPIKNLSIGKRHHNIKKEGSCFIFHGKKVYTNYNENTFFKVSFMGDTLSSLVTDEDSIYDGGIEFSKLNNNWFYIVGRQNSYSSFTQSGDIITKLDSSGNILWRKKYRNNFPHGLAFTSIKETPDTGLIIAGFKPVSSTLYKPYLFKVNSNGDSLWFKEFGSGSNISLFYDLINTSDGGYAIVGETTPNGSPYSYSYIVKTDANGDLLNVADELLKKEKNYLHLYPNPANTYTNIHYIGTIKNVVLKITNLQGQVIYTEYITSNEQRISINTTNYKPGIYFCSVLSNGKNLQSQKLVVMH